MVSLFSVILQLCSKCVFLIWCASVNFLCSLPVKEPSEQGRRLTGGPYLLEREVFRTGSSLLGLHADQTHSSCRGPADYTRPVSCSEATGPGRVGLAAESH